MVNLTDLYFVNEDGQFEIDFDSLALITSGDFVTLIHNEIKSMRVRKVAIEESNSFVSVYIRTGSRLYEFAFHKVTKDYIVNDFSLYVAEALGGEF